MKVLVIDDSSTARLFVKKMTAMIMGEGSVDFFEADSGESAFRFLREHKGFDLIISDVNMPEMSGFTFMHNLKLDKTLFQIPVIFVT
ncbi:MAG: response regulator, partial [Bacteriovoracaceae bacterium]|nr:response regulator [Bacteriovoracaceae bacterium]